MQKIQVIGRLGKDPELREVGDSKVVNFSVATTEKGFTRQDGTKVEDHTEWFNCTAWNRLAEVIAKYLKQGDLIYIEGKNRTRKYENNGVEMKTTDVIVSQMEMLGSKGGGPSEAPQQDPQQEEDDLPF